MIYRIFATITVETQVRWFDVESGSKEDAQLLVTKQIRKDFGNRISICVDDVTAVKHIGTYYNGVLQMDDMGEGVYAPAKED